EPATTEVIDDSSRRKGDAVPIAGAQPEVLQPGGHGCDRLLAVGGAASKNDGISKGSTIAVSKTVRVDGSGRTAAHIHRDRGSVSEMNDSEPRWAFLVAADSDLDRWPVEAQDGAVDLRICLEDALISMGRTENGRRGEDNSRKDS